MERKKGTCRHWRTLLGVIFSTTLLITAAACNRGPNVSTVDGQKLYFAYCVSCHGADGAGGKVLGAADLRAQNLGPRYDFNMALLRRAILDGKDASGADMDPAMPLFRGKLSDEQATSILVFMQSLRAPPNTNIPPDQMQQDMPE